MDRLPAAGDAPLSPPANSGDIFDPSGWDVQRIVHPDERLLFRYSALTFNGHLIHYDREFCRGHEGYPDLIIHGPLIATLLMGLGSIRVSGVMPWERSCSA